MLTEEIDDMFKNINSQIRSLGEDLKDASKEDRKECIKMLEGMYDKYMQPIEDMLYEKDPIKRKEMAQRHLDKTRSKKNE